LAGDIADEGLVDVACADEAVIGGVRGVLLWVCGRSVPLVNVCWCHSQLYALPGGVLDAYLARTYLRVMCVCAAGAGGGGDEGDIAREIGRSEAKDDEALDERGQVWCAVRRAVVGVAMLQKLRFWWTPPKPQLPRSRSHASTLRRPRFHLSSLCHPRLEIALRPLLRI